jgi:Flp pilus assembly protein TadD
MVREILAHWPDDYDANSLMGAILVDLDEFDESIKYLDRAIQIDPNDDLAYGHKAGALLFKGDLAGAEACARKEL